MFAAAPGELTRVFKERGFAPRRAAGHCAVAGDTTGGGVGAGRGEAGGARRVAVIGGRRRGVGREGVGRGRLDCGVASAAARGGWTSRSVLRSSGVSGRLAGVGGDVILLEPLPSSCRHEVVSAAVPARLMLRYYPHIVVSVQSWSRSLSVLSFSPLNPDSMLSTLLTAHSL